MTHDSRQREIQTAAADLANSLIYRDRYASIHLARLILAGEDSAFLQFAEAVVDRLRAWRWEQAQAQTKPPFVIFHNSVLRRSAATRPSSLDELLAVKGIGPAKLEQYGQAVIDLLRDYGSQSVVLK